MRLDTRHAGNLESFLSKKTGIFFETGQNLLLGCCNITSAVFRVWEYSCPPDSVEPMCFTPVRRGGLLPGGVPVFEHLRHFDPLFLHFLCDIFTTSDKIYHYNQELSMRYTIRDGGMTVLNFRRLHEFCRFMHS